MCRKLLAALLILGWITLSCFDVIEDLDEIPAQAAVSNASPDDGSRSKISGWGPLLNNIVEFANFAERPDSCRVSFSPTVLETDLIVDFRGHIPLHKLYHVFLI